MKAILIGHGSGASMDKIMEVFPRHKVVLDKFIANGDVIGVGQFADRSGNLAIFRSREAAEQFSPQDPFILEGIIESFMVHEWADEMLN